MLYTNKYGEIKKREECIDSYHSQDLSIRGVSAKVAFKEDLKQGNFKKLTPGYCYLPDDGDCSSCMLCRGNKDCNNKTIKSIFLKLRKTT